MRVYFSVQAFLKMLCLFIDLPFNDNIILEKPAGIVLTDSISRPELLMYDYQKKLSDIQGELLKVQLRPRFNLFAQGGYGRPGLNLLSNNFEGYYLGGLRFTWNFGSWYSLKNQRQLMGINKKLIDVQKETFLFNLHLTRQQQNTDMEKFLALIKKDDAIIEKRESVTKAANAQFENGVLTAHDYITQLLAEDLARQNRILHEVQMLQAQFNYQYTLGNVRH